jgi:Na+:H+ antiporter, NhaC family
LKFRGGGLAFVALILPGRAFLPTLEDGSTITSPLIPWSLAACFIVEVLDVPATTYAPYAFFNLLCPLFSILAGRTGFAIFRRTEQTGGGNGEPVVR